MFLLLCACNNPTPLPILGETEIINGDTVYYQIENFSFTNQKNETVTNSNFANKIYVADFFFTSCPTICPIMKKNMLLIQEAYKNDVEVLLLSHSIDPKHDTPERLNDYGKRLGIIPEKWFLVTGDKSKIYEAAKMYMVAAQEDANAPGGYLHSGALVLIDKQKRIRGYYDGTIDSEVKALIKDIAKLQQEQ
jgi:protein SCO1/2